MTIDLVLSCTHCRTDYDRFAGRTEREILDIAAANGWVSVVIDHGREQIELDLCPECKVRPDAELIAVYEGAPF